MRSTLLLAGLLALALPLHAEERYPGEQWEVAESVQEVGFSADRLAEAIALAETLKTTALMVIVDGVVVAQWGRTERIYPIHSIRKSLLSGLYGIAAATGQIDTLSTLAELGIDELGGLTESERSATVSDLLTTRSGIYLPSAYAPRGMIRGLPERGSHPSGSNWHYNNWDFNALGTIYEQQTGHSIFAAFDTLIAGPIGMQDYQTDAGVYERSEASQHAAYLFKLSARDLARFGMLYLQGGIWNGAQIVPAAWVSTSTSAHVLGIRDGRAFGYGFMWWVGAEGGLFPGIAVPPGSFAAHGAPVQALFVVPAMDMVIVSLAETINPSPASFLDNDDERAVLGLILAAAP